MKPLTHINMTADINKQINGMDKIVEKFWGAVPNYAGREAIPNRIIDKKSENISRKEVQKQLWNINGDRKMQH